MAFETLERRLALAIHTEDFRDDFDPTQPGFDSWDADPLTIPGGDTDADPQTVLGPDELLIPHDVGPFHSFVRNRFGNSTHFLLIGAPDSYLIDFAAGRVEPGGLDSDAEVVTVGFRVFGTGQVVVEGDNGVKTLDIDAFVWSGLAVVSNDPSDNGGEVGAIQRVRFTPTGDILNVDDVSVLVLDAGFSNNAPSAGPDFVTTRPGQPVVIDFLANDGDIDGDPISLVAYAVPAADGTITPKHGSVILTQAGRFLYVPNPGFHGIDSFLYTITDNRITRGTEPVGTVQITVNTPPPARHKVFFAPHGHTGVFSVAAPGLLDGLVDADGDPLAIRVTRQPSHGTVNIAPDGAFVYTPTAPDGRLDSDSIEYVANDGFADSDPMLAEIMLANHRPRLTSELHFTDVDNVPVPFAPSPLIGELAWSDDDGDAVTPLILLDHRPRHGRAELRIVGGQVRIEYYPHNNHFAPYDEFRVAVTDGLAQSNTAVVRVTREDNTAPIAVNDFFVIQNRPVGAADTEPVLFAFPGVTWNDQDPDDDFLIVTLVSNPAHGALMLEDDGRFIYRPQRDFVGMDTFVYRVDDGSGITSQATVTMRVLDEFAPTAFDDLKLSGWGGNLIPADIVPEEFTYRTYGTFIVDNDILPADWQGFPAPVISPSADWALRLIPRPRQVEGTNFLIVHEGHIDLDPRGWVGLKPLLQDGNGDLYISFVTGAVEVTYAFRDLNHPGYLSNFARLRIVVAPPAQGSYTLRTVQGLPGDRIGIQSSPGTVLDVADLVDPPVAPPSGMGLLYDKLINLVISDVEPGGAATVTLTYNQNLPAGATYMKYGRRDDDPSTPADESQAQWYDFSFDPITGTGAQIVGSQIILHFVDGLRGDNDRLANGVIFDPGGPVIPIDLIQGTDGDDDIHVVRAGDELAIYVNVAPMGDPTYRVPLDRITALTILGGQGDDVLTVDCGQQTTLGLDRLVYNAGAGNNTLVLANGSARIESAAPGGTLNTTVQAGARLTTSRLNQNALSLQSNSRVTLLPAGETSLITSLSLAAGATLDVGNNALVLDYTGDSPLAEIREKILSGRGGPGFGASWNGTGITSSAAAQANQADPESRSVALAENASLPLGPYATFRGQVVDNTSILIAYTRTADADLNGIVNDDDVTIVGATYAPGVPQPHWGLGDFDYNGFVDDDDVTLLGVFYDPGAAPLAVPPPAAPQLWDRRGELIELLAESMACNQPAQHEGLSDTWHRSGRKPRPTDNLWSGWEETIP